MEGKTISRWSVVKGVGRGGERDAAQPTQSRRTQEGTAANRGRMSKVYGELLRRSI